MTQRVEDEELKLVGMVLVGMVDEIRGDGSQRACEACEMPTGPIFFVEGGQEICWRCLRARREPHDAPPATRADVERLEAMIARLEGNQARLESALKAHGVGAWGNGA